MNWYKENQTEWKEIIETVARELGKSEQRLEKDTIQSMFLFELAKSELFLRLFQKCCHSKVRMLTMKLSNAL